MRIIPSLHEARTHECQRTIRSLAGHVTRQMLEHYSHVRSQGKQAAIRCPQEQASTPVLDETGHKIGHNSETTSEQEDAKSLKTVGGAARI